MTPRSPFVAIVTYALRACLPTKRRLGLLLPCAAAVLFGLLSQLSGDDPAEAFASVASGTLFAIVLPIGCLIIGDAVLGAEARSGTLHFTWLSPVPFWTIAVGRWTAGYVVALLSVTVSCALAALAAGVGEAVPAMVVAVAAGSAAYIGVFIMLGTVTRRAAVWSLAFVVLIEQMLGAALDGIAQLSPQHLARSVYADLGPNADHLAREGVPQGSAAVVRLVFVLAVTLGVASWRLGHLRVTGASD